MGVTAATEERTPGRESCPGLRSVRNGKKAGATEDRGGGAGPRCGQGSRQGSVYEGS